MMTIATALILSFTRYTDWGHSPYAAVAFDVQLPLIAPNSTVLIVGQPNAYIVPFFPHATSSRFVGVNWLSGGAEHFHLGELTREAIRNIRACSMR